MSRKKESFVSFRIASLCTRISKFSPINIIRKFIDNSTECSKITYPNDNQVDFDYFLKKNNYIKTNCYEIPDLGKNTSILAIVDCIIVFVDLEFEDSLNVLENIVNVIINKGNKSNKIYVIGVYDKVGNIQEELQEEKFNELLDSRKLFYEYLEVCVELNLELEKIFEKIIKDFAKDKEETNQQSEKHKVLNIRDEDNSGSGCLIV